MGEDGRLIHPFYREVAVVGIPIQEAEERIRALLQREMGPTRLVVEPLLQVFVGGEVREPGVIGMRPGTTLTQAIALAGGPTDDARLSRVRVLRNAEVIVTNLVRVADPSLQVTVLSGDQVVVARRYNFISDYVVPVSTVTSAFFALIGFIL